MSDDVPTAFTIQASPVLRWLMAAFTFLGLVSLLGDFDVMSALIVLGLAAATVVQWSWSAEVDSQGLTFRNRAGVSWHRDWGELRPDVRVRRPGTFGALVRARTTSGRFVSLPNGTVRTPDGRRLAPETVQGLIRGWAEAGIGDGGDGGDGPDVTNEDGAAGA